MSLVIFLLIGLMAGDPIDIMIFSNPEMTTAEADRLRALYGLDRPILERYLAWLGNALAGDFGYSRLYNQPTLEVLLPRLGNTVVLMGLSFVLALAPAQIRRAACRGRVCQYGLISVGAVALK